tara:strand:+ start:487 stop:1671 length:1185 start_codon:yes stop_codon:yes gene_type:complete
MAVEKYYNGDGSDKTFDITFPFLETGDVKAAVGGVTQNAGTDYSITGTVVTFTTAPPSGTSNVHLYRNTDVSTAKATFTAGASIKALDLNNVVKQCLYAIEEVGTVTANDTGLGLVAGSKGDIHVNSATDWYIKTGVIDNTMLSNLTLSGSKLANDCIDGTKIANDALDSEHYVAGSIDEEHLATNSVTTTKIQDATITASKLSTAAQGTLLNPVGTVIWYGGTAAPTGYLKCNGDSIPNGTGTVQSITADFSALYNVIGSTIPDLRGEFIRGFDDGRNVDQSRVIRSAQTDGYKSHDHGVSLATTSSTASLTGTANKVGEPFGTQGSTTGIFGGPNSGYSSSNTPSSVDSTEAGQLTIDASHTHSVQITGNTNTSGTTETRPRNVALLACIKY